MIEQEPTAIAPGSIVDAHFHVWDPAKRRHAWLDRASPELRRRFDLDDFSAASAASGVRAAVLVQALASAADTDDMLELATTSALVAGVVGWVDLTAPDVADALAAVRQRPGGSSLVGIRHLVHDEPDPHWLERPEVIRGLRAVAEAELVYDLLVRPRELPSALVAVDAVPGGRFVLDHGGKPEVAAGVTEPWSALVGELAARPHVACKFSGLVTEAGRSWTEKDFGPYVDHLLESFGPERLLFGSDWPVCTAVASYGDVVSLARSLLGPRLAGAEAEMVMASTAVDIYGLGPRPR